MQSQNTLDAGRSEVPQLVIRPELVPAVVRALEQDREHFARQTDDDVSDYSEAEAIPSLIEAVRAGEQIDLTARTVPRPEADTWTSPAAKWYGSTGVYLLGAVARWPSDDVETVGAEVTAIILADAEAA
jgi:hypothetical protein